MLPTGSLWILPHQTSIKKKYPTGLPSTCSYGGIFFSIDVPSLQMTLVFIRLLLKTRCHTLPNVPRSSFIFLQTKKFSSLFLFFLSLSLSSLCLPLIFLLLLSFSLPSSTHHCYSPHILSVSVSIRPLSLIYAGQQLLSVRLSWSVVYIPELIPLKNTECLSARSNQKW